MTNLLIQNDLVLLRPIQLEDAEEVAAVATDERIWEHIAYTLATEEDVTNYVQKQVALNEKGERIVLVIIDKITNKIIGSTSIYDFSFEHARCEIGSTWLTPAYWRTAINTNCKYLLFQHLFEEKNFNRIQIKTDNRNIRSQQAIERIGAKFEGQLRRHMLRKDGSLRDTMMYSIIREEWPEVKAKLESLIYEYEDR